MAGRATLLTRAKDALEAGGEVVILLFETLRGFPTLFRRRRLLVRHAYEVGNQSLVIVFVMSLLS